MLLITVLVLLCGLVSAARNRFVYDNTRFSSRKQTEESLSYIKAGGLSNNHRGKSYTYTCNNLLDWKNTKFPNEKIDIDLVWNVTHVYYNPDGTYRSGYVINGQSPGPAIQANEGDWIRIVVNNYIPVPMTIHFHGIDQVYTPWSDGMPGITQYPILSGGSYAYIFQFKNQHGAFWYHSHYRGSSQDGIYGPIYIKPKASVNRPYSLISGVTKDDVNFITQQESDPINIMVSDGYPLNSDDVFARLYHNGVLPLCSQSVLINGKGRITCQTAEDINAAAEIRGNVAFGNTLVYDGMGCNGPPVTGASSDESVALQAPGFVSCSKSTTNDREIIYTEDQKYLFINVFNMASEYPKAFSIDEHDLIVVGVGGSYVTPRVVQQLEMPVATRFTVIVKPKSGVTAGSAFSIRFATTEIFQVIEGVGYLVYGKSGGDTSSLQTMTDAPSTRRQDIGGSLINSNDTKIKLEELELYGSELVPKKGAAHHTVHLMLNGTGGIHFSIFDDRTLFNPARELDAPYLLQTDPSKLDFSKIPAAIAPGIKLGQVVDIIVDNTVLLSHPFHMHGHSFSVISTSQNETFQYSNIAEALRRNPKSVNLKNPPFVDTVEVHTGGHVVIRFTATNPGYWFLHCHITHHLAAGMGGFIVIDPQRIPRIPLALYDQPHADYDSSTELSISEPEE